MELNDLQLREGQVQANTEGSALLLKRKSATLSLQLRFRHRRVATAGGEPAP
jgi:hypothetical protein